MIMIMMEINGICTADSNSDSKSQYSLINENWEYSLMIMIMIPGWASLVNYFWSTMVYGNTTTIQTRCTMNHNSNNQEQTHFPAAEGLLGFALLDDNTCPL